MSSRDLNDSQVKEYTCIAAQIIGLTWIGKDTEIDKKS